MVPVQVYISTTFPLTVYRCFLFLLSLFSIAFLIIGILKYVRWYLIAVLICIFLKINDIRSFFFLFSLFFYCCSSTVVSIFTPSCPPIPPIPASHPQTYHLWLCLCILYTCSLMDLPQFFPIIPPHPPLWLLSACSLFQCLWLYFACLFVLLIRFHL